MLFVVAARHFLDGTKPLDCSQHISPDVSNVAPFLGCGACLRKQRKWRPLMAAIFASASVTLLTMTSRSNFEFGIHAFDSSICVECGDSEIREALERFIFPPLPRRRSSPSSPDIHLRVDKSTEGFRVLLDHKLVASVITLHDAAVAAVKALDDAVVRRMKMFRAVHAGAVLIGGSALLLPGSTHAGKSSLVAELLRRGASNFSDEYALIDNEGRVHSYPRPLLLRNGLPQPSLVLPEELNASFATCSAPVGWILALNYLPAGAWDIHQLSQAEAVMLLLRNTPHEMTQSGEMVDFFLRVAANAVCYAGQRGDVAEAATYVVDLVGRIL
jgi:hypothetical protein